MSSPNPISVLSSLKDYVERIQENSARIQNACKKIRSAYEQACQFYADLKKNPLLEGVISNIETLLCEAKGFQAEAAQQLKEVENLWEQLNALDEAHSFVITAQDALVKAMSSAEKSIILVGHIDDVLRQTKYLAQQALADEQVRIETERAAEEAARIAEQERVDQETEERKRAAHHQAAAEAAAREKKNKRNKVKARIEEVTRTTHASLSSSSEPLPVLFLPPNNGKMPLLPEDNTALADCIEALRATSAWSETALNVIKNNRKLPERVIKLHQCGLLCRSTFLYSQQHDIDKLIQYEVNDWKKIDRYSASEIDEMLSGILQWDYSISREILQSADPLKAYRAHVFSVGSSTSIAVVSTHHSERSETMPEGQARYQALLREAGISFDRENDRYTENLLDIITALQAINMLNPANFEWVTQDEIRQQNIKKLIELEIFCQSTFLYSQLGNVDKLIFWEKAIDSNEELQEKLPRNDWKRIDSHPRCVEIIDKIIAMHVGEDKLRTDLMINRYHTWSRLILRSDDPFETLKKIDDTFEIENGILTKVDLRSIEEKIAVLARIKKPSLAERSDLAKQYMDVARYKLLDVQIRAIEKELDPRDSEYQDILKQFYRSALFYYRHANLLEKALECTKKFIEINDNTVMRFFQGVILFELGRYGESFVAFKKLMLIAPSYHFSASVVRVADYLREIDYQLSRTIPQLKHFSPLAAPFCDYSTLDALKILHLVADPKIAHKLQCMSTAELADRELQRNIILLHDMKLLCRSTLLLAKTPEIGFFFKLEGAVTRKPLFNDWEKIDHYSEAEILELFRGMLQLSAKNNDCYLMASRVVLRSDSPLQYLSKALTELPMDVLLSQEDFERVEAEFIVVKSKLEDAIIHSVEITELASTYGRYNKAVVYASDGLTWLRCLEGKRCSDAASLIEIERDIHISLMRNYFKIGTPESLQQMLVHCEAIIGMGVSNVDPKIIEEVRSYQTSVLSSSSAENGGSHCPPAMRLS